MSRCSSIDKLPRVFSVSIASMSMAWRAAGKSGSSSFSAEGSKESNPSRISAWVFRENTRNSKVGGGKGNPVSLIACILVYLRRRMIHLR